MMEMRGIRTQTYSIMQWLSIRTKMQVMAIFAMQKGVAEGIHPDREIHFFHTLKIRNVKIFSYVLPHLCVLLRPIFWSGNKETRYYICNQTDVDSAFFIIVQTFLFSKFLISP